MVTPQVHLTTHVKTVKWCLVKASGLSRRHHNIALPFSSADTVFKFRAGTMPGSSRLPVSLQYPGSIQSSQGQFLALNLDLYVRKPETALLYLASASVPSSLTDSIADCGISF